MNNKKPNKPTQSEVEILRILWEQGPSTVRQVHEIFGGERSVGYTGVLKLLQNMLAKGLVSRNEEHRSHVYAACEAAGQAKKQLVADLIRRVFAGSSSQLVLHLLEDEKASPEEIAEIRRMVADYRSKPR